VADQRAALGAGIAKHYGRQAPDWLEAGEAPPPPTPGGVSRSAEGRQPCIGRLSLPGAGGDGRPVVCERHAGSPITGPGPMTPTAPRWHERRSRQARCDRTTTSVRSTPPKPSRHPVVLSPRAQL